ncbi:MAG: hypothetical protein H8E86_02495 [Planctomycetes bacterium]|nr:hypothetical protein [Planctomycetota bacterium]
MEKVQRRILRFIVPLVLVQLCGADTFTTTLEAPNFDRWMYPYNSTVGSREVASTFSSIGGGFEIFDDRDGQILLGFITPEDIPVGLGVSQYEIVEATVHISISNDGNVYDPTVDAWESYLPDSGVEDVDAGRPMELYGAAFRGGFNGWTFGETGPFPFGASRRERNAYPVSFLNGFQPIDVSNNVLDAFQPEPFAIGENAKITPGSVIETETVLSFAINVADPEIQCYLRHSFNEGLLSFVVSSLHQAQQPGLRKTVGLVQPNFHMKESWAVYLGLADAAKFSFTVIAHEATTVPEDLDGDGSVGVSDILIALSDWGFCSCCSSDLNADGEVNVSDLLAIIAAWDS